MLACWYGRDAITRHVKHYLQSPSQCSARCLAPAQAGHWHRLGTVASALCCMSSDSAQLTVSARHVRYHSDHSLVRKMTSVFV